MASTNSVLPFLGGNQEETSDAIGITQFPSAGNWFQVLGGLTIQGGKVSVLSGATLSVAFNAPISKEVLGVFIQPIGTATVSYRVNSVTLNDFAIVNGAADQDFYWWAIGV